MHLHTLTICLLLLAIASGYARFTVFAPEGSTLLNAAFLCSTVGLVMCLIRIGSRQMEHIGRSNMHRWECHDDDS